MYLGKKGVEGGLIALRSLLKRVLELSIHNKKSPLWSLYDNPFHVKCLWEKKIIKRWSRKAFTIGYAIALPLTAIVALKNER